MKVESASDTRVVKNILLCALLCLLIAWLWSRRNLYRFTLKFPGALEQLIFGTMLEMQNLHNIDGAITNYFKRFKQYSICLWIGLYPMLVTADPDIVEKILTSQDLLHKSPPMYIPINSVSLGGLISSSGSKWRRNRKLIAPSFSHNVLMSFLPVFHTTKVSLLSKLEAMVDKGEQSLSDMIACATLTASIQTTMGKRANPGEEVPEKYTQQLRFLTKNVVHHMSLSFLKLGFLFNGYPKYNTTKNELHQAVIGLIKEKEEEMAHQHLGPVDNDAGDGGNIRKTPRIFIEQAIKLYNQNKFAYSDVVAESNTLVSAAFETTSNVIFSTLVMLATHPVIQECLFDEIVTIFPDKDFVMEYDDMQKLPYLDMVIKETLRLSPAITVIGRNVVNDTHLTKDLILPKGLQILISIYHLHRRTDVWGPNANEFNPDNFLPLNFERIHTYAYLPFSKGTRNCIGWRYAMLSLKAILCGFIRNYRFTTSTKFEDLRIVNHVSMKYVNEPQIAIHRRE